MRTAIVLFVLACPAYYQEAFAQDAADVTRQKFDRIIAALQKMDQRFDKQDQRLSQLENARKDEPKRLGYVEDYSGNAPTLRRGEDIPTQESKPIDLVASKIKEQEVIFFVVVVKPTVIKSKVESDNLIDFLSPAFENRPIVLMGYDPRQTTTYYGRKDIVEFLANVDQSTIPFTKYQLTYSAR